MTQNSKTINTAIEILRGATRHPVAVGDTVRYYDDASQAWYVAPNADLASLVEYYAEDPSTGYSLWCAEHAHEAAE